MAAVRETGDHYLNISERLRRADQQTAGGFIWAYGNGGVISESTYFDSYLSGYCHDYGNLRIISLR